MAFFSAISSSIGKKLLLFGLRHVDILDKDPADFVSVDVGKTTTLEVRDVGLHTKKLIALLHLKLPPELRLSKAHVNSFRATVVFEFGVPQIIIELEDLRIRAELVEDNDGISSKDVSLPDSSNRVKPHPRPSSPFRHRESPIPEDNSDSDSSFEVSNDHLPTVDDLAKSFIKEEPAEEIQVLEQALNSQAESLHASTSSSSDDETEGVEGMGVGLGVPGFIKNLLDGALDRLRVVASNIEIRFDQQLHPESGNSPGDLEDQPVSVKLEFEKISMESLSSPQPQVDITASSFASVEAHHQRKRRLRIENICARLISTAENFATVSCASGPPSPVGSRSGPSADRRSDAGSSPSPASPAFHQPTAEARVQQAIDINAEQTLDDSILEPPEPRPASPESSREDDGLASSALTNDDDRFADAGSDDGLDAIPDPPYHAQSRMGESSILYDDHGVLEYALENNLLDSEHRGFSEDPADEAFIEQLGSDGMAPGHDMIAQPSVPNSGLLQPSPPVRISSPLIDLSDSLPQPQPLPEPKPERSSESPGIARTIDPLTNPLEALPSPSRSVESLPDLSPDARPSSPVEDLSESKIFTHDEAESMYLSAMSATPLDASRKPHVPGGWDSSSVSSRSSTSQPASDAASDIVPEEMIASSILQPPPEPEDRCETPRPGTRQRTEREASSGLYKGGSMVSEGSHLGTGKLSQVFLTIDEINVWFSFGLGEEGGTSEPLPSPKVQAVHFGSESVADSLFQDIPGSFSFYAQSTAARNRKNSSGAQESSKSPRFTQTAGPQEKPSVSNVSVDIGSVTSHVDFSTCRIFFQMAQRLLPVLSSSPSEPRDSSPIPAASSDVSAEMFSLSIKHIGFAWLERLMTSSEAKNGQLGTLPKLEVNPLDKILSLELDAMQLQTDHKGDSALHIRKFALASLGQNIISFQQSKSKSRRLDGTTGRRLENDIEVIFSQTPERRLRILSRPVIVLFDMQRLDEALSSYGGFSGILELSTSMGTAQPGLPQSPVPRARAVHFGDAPAPLPPVQSSPPEVVPSVKVDVQFGDVLFTLKGKSCALQIRTSPVRLALRQGNVRMKISSIELSGPYLNTFDEDPCLVINIKDTAVAFLFTPEEEDLTRLISMITPSKDPYENDEDILIDTLLRQRRKGSVLRVELGNFGLQMSNLDQIQTLQALGNELSKLSRVTKYLPDDDRPGILTLAWVRNINAHVKINERIGILDLACGDLHFAHVGLPSLLALQVGDISVTRGTEVIVGEVTPLRPQDQLPQIMARIIGDEMEPVVKAKLFNLCIEYRVSTLMAALGIREDGTIEELAEGLASSVSTVTGVTSSKGLSRQPSAVSDISAASNKPFHADLLFRNCAIGLNPRKIPSKGLFVLSDAHFASTIAPDDISLQVDLRKASIHAIDDVVRLEGQEVAQSQLPISSASNRQLHDLRQSGYVSLGSISAAKANVKVLGDGKGEEQIVDVEFKNDLFVMESCADSTQTLIGILNGLQPPTPPSTDERYRTTVVPIQDMMASLSGEEMLAPGQNDPEEFMEDADRVADEVPANLEFVGSFYNPDSVPTEEDLGDSMLGEDDLGTLAAPPITRQRGERALLESFNEQYEVAKEEDEFDFNENYFVDSDSDVKGTARKWDSRANQYHLSNEFKTPNAPLKVRVRDVNIVWNLFDGYDWPRTRQIISQAVDDVEARAEERRRKNLDEDDEKVFIEEDFLFNSVWIGVPVKEERGALARKINRDIDDAVSETGSYAPSTASRATGSTVRPHSATKSRRRRLKLERSKHKKITFELSDVAVDLVVFPPNTGETQNSLNVRVRNMEIFDHMPSSTWRKFLTSLQDPSEREMGRPMINLEMLTVKPVDDIPTSEIVLRVTVLPLRLHVDQDALDFITRFFEFKDDEAPGGDVKGEQPFLQRVEVNTVVLKLDYKPKKVDYAGLRSGHTTEFMNFFILDGADIILRHAILYGITSFDKLHKTLNDVWMPDVKRNQLPGVLAGLAPVRGIVNVTSGVRDLVVIPVREYKKDGRVVRSVQKGVVSFAKNTTSEVFRLGAKIAIGAQNVLEGAEAFLSPETSSSRQSQLDWEDLDPSDDGEDEPRAVSNYANQPIGVMAGLRGAGRHLERDILTAREAIIAIPGEVMETGTGAGMAKVLAKRAPTVILKPVIGVSKAVSHTLLGVGNALDKDAQRKIHDKYKTY